MAMFLTQRADPGRLLFQGCGPGNLNSKGGAPKVGQGLAHAEHKEAIAAREKALHSRHLWLAALHFLRVQIERQGQQQTFALPQPRQRFQLRLVGGQHFNAQTAQLAS